jgi:hypothetical protein
MKWIKSNNGADLGGRACAGTPAYISEDGTMVVLKLNEQFDTKTPWMLRELRNGQIYYLDCAIMENHGYARLKDAQADGEKYIKAIQERKKAPKRVVQISLDIVVGIECDGMKLADDVAEELDKKGYTVVGVGFQEDMTELYKEQYPELLNTNELS